MSTTLVEAGTLKPGKYVVFDDKACIVKSIQISKPGKHGGTKCRIEAVSIKDGQKTIKIIPSHDNVDVPMIEKETAQVVSVAGDKATVMDMKTYETFDLEIPEELKGQVKEGMQIMYWIMLDERIMKQTK
ncbi:MAG: translation initiation factor IF-5A [Candidatus Nanoarchaeia archaeon]|nr:translation initiation factor IF-5A [Candidatus Nanoarchaeia archaeon]